MLIQVSQTATSYASTLILRNYYYYIIICFKKLLFVYVTLDQSSIWKGTNTQI